MSALSEIGVFAAKSGLVLLFIVLLVVVIGVIKQKSQELKALIQIENLNENFDILEQTLKAHILDDEAFKNEKKRLKFEEKAKKAAKKANESTPSKSKVYVLDFKGDIKAHAGAHLREEITAVLTVAQPKDEVVVRLESPGGMVHEYGFCSSQLNRIKEAGIPLTVCVDKVAASGGYMMAVVANKIHCAPFAIVGSVGVVAQVPNVNKLLKKHDINYTEYTAGEYKRTVSVLGEITPKGEEKFKEELEETHKLFKHFVGHHRPQLDVPKIATGEHWYGTQALSLGLVDQLGTSDDYLLSKRKSSDIYKVTFKAKKHFSEKIAESFSKSMVSVTDRLIERCFFKFY